MVALLALYVPLVLFATTGTAQNTVTKYSKLQATFSFAQTSSSIALRIPTNGEHAISDPTTLFAHVKETWDTVVKDNQAGLVDPRAEGQQLAPLSQEEAWHHWKAGQEGVVDSGRLLLAFGMVPSVSAET